MCTRVEIVKQYLNPNSMTSHLRVECSSHCTTPSERNEEYPVTVKVGCIHVNPATPRGRRKFLIHMLILCFVPHAALIIQNCTIMAQLSQTLDSALYLNSEVETVLALEELILALQEERQQGADFLLQDAKTHMNRSVERTFSATDAFFGQISPSIVKDSLMITLYHFRNDLTNFIDLQKVNSYKRISVYEEINSVLLLYAAHQIKFTSNVLWRQSLASNALLKSMEEISLALTFLTYYAYSKSEDSLRICFLHQYSAIDHLVSTAQYIEVEKLAQSGRIIQEIIDLYKPVNWQIKAKLEGNIQINSTRAQLVQLRDVHEDLVRLIRESVIVEVWRARRTLGVGVIILMLVLLASPLLVLLLRHIIHTIQTFTHSIELTTQRLMAEKQKSDLLLSRMLPLPVLKRLRAQRTVPAESFDAVTIFFSDIVGFTTISATSTPMEVINMLNMLYKLFDEKLLQYNVYKVETIGDAYMVVSGLPQRNGNRHASEIADMSLSLMRSLEGATVPHRPHEALRVRAGVNTGPCVAGVVGTTMPRYCLFGDTINTASRMESTGEAMKIHISYSTKKALDEIGNYETESRGIVDVAGKGNMETFWLVGKVGGLQAESPRCRLNDYDQNLLEILIKQ